MWGVRADDPTPKGSFLNDVFLEFYPDALNPPKTPDFMLWVRESLLPEPNCLAKIAS